MKTVWVVFIVDEQIIDGKNEYRYEAINSFDDREAAIKYSDYICKSDRISDGIGYHPKTMVSSCKIHEWDEHLEEVEDAEM